ncbi:hypothetical protein B0H13DRAFT_2038906 [Mycena leptocephala]|nr:hypothetical protein B0H13DRAFT_2038906 [Mycena leptocephala]
MSLSSALVSGLTEGVLELTLYGKRPTFFVFLALVGLFASITAHWLTIIYVLYLTFIHLGGGFAAEVYYLTLSTTTSVVHFSLVEVATVITDGLVIHRLYVVWSCNPRVVVLPIFILACQIVSGIHIVYDISRETIFNFYVLSNPWVTSSLVSSLVISLYSTGMIALKLWSMSRSIRSELSPGALAQGGV